MLLLLQVKIDEAQLKEQEALRKQLQQEQDLLQTFQEAQDQKLKVQHERERTALDEKVELSKKELEKEVKYVNGYPLDCPPSISHAWSHTTPALSLSSLVYHVLQRQIVASQ